MTNKPAKPKGQKSLTFYPSDYAGDVELAQCSMGAQGFWMRCLCLAALSDGLVLVGGRKPSVDALAHAARVRPEEWANVAGWMMELITEGVCDVTGDDHPLGAGIMINRRMARAKEEHQRAVEIGKLGGNPKLLGERDNLLDLLDGAAREAIKREKAAERNRRWRASQRDAGSVTRDAYPPSRSVSRDVTPSVSLCHAERLADDQTSSAPSDAAPRDAVNPPVNPIPSLSLPSHKSSLPEAAEPRSSAPASPVNGAGALAPRRRGRDPRTPEQRAADRAAAMGDAEVALANVPPGSGFAAARALDGDGARDPPTSPIVAPPDERVH